MAKQTSKDRVRRIPPDYFKRSDAIRRNRNYVTLIAAAGAIGLVAAIGISRYLHAGGISPGPVARVHATWDQQCDACHKPWTPIEPGAWWAKSAAGTASADIEKCQACHIGALHHPHQKIDDVESCAACHTDHRGREASLTELDDRACTRCHAQIKEHFAPDSRTPHPVSGNVTSFPLVHPEFRSLQRRDPTKLKFNHKRHLLPGLRLPTERQPAWTLADVAETDRTKYRREAQSDDQTPVQLECSDCHRSAADQVIDRRAASGLSRELTNLPRNQSPLATGAYMLPVKYEEHCQGCHPLAIRRTADAVPQGIEVPHGLEVPHRVQEERLRQLLEGWFWEQQVRKQPQRESLRPRTPPFPGQSQDRVSREAQATVAEQLREAERHFQDVGCAKCHELHDRAEPDGLVSVVPVEMPAVWLQHAHFNHMAHQSIKKCQACHAAESSTETADVLIAGLEKCRECHAPSTASGKTPSGQTPSGQTGGADFRCVECHRYHRDDLAAPDRPAEPAHGVVGQLVAPLRKGNHARD